MVNRKIQIFLQTSPTWLIIVAYIVGLSVILTGLFWLFGWHDLQRNRVRTQQTAMLRQHYPTLSVLFAQWDTCYGHPIEPDLAAQICDHYLLKDADVISRTPEALAFLRECDANDRAAEGF